MYSVRVIKLGIIEPTFNDKFCGLFGPETVYGGHNSRKCVVSCKITVYEVGSRTLYIVIFR